MIKFPLQRDSLILLGHLGFSERQNQRLISSIGSIFTNIVDLYISWMPGAQSSILKNDCTLRARMHHSSALLIYLPRILLTCSCTCRHKGVGL